MVAFNEISNIFAEKLGMVYNLRLLSLMEEYWQRQCHLLSDDELRAIQRRAVLKYDPHWERSDDSVYCQNQRLVEAVVRFKR